MQNLTTKDDDSSARDDVIYLCLYFCQLLLINSGFYVCVCVCVCDSFVLYAKLPDARHERSLQSQSQYGCKVSLRDEYPECWLGKVSVVLVDDD